MLLVSVFLLMKEQKTLLDLWLPQHLINMISCLSSDIKTSDYSSLKAEAMTTCLSCTRSIPHGSLVPGLGLLPPIIQQFLAFGNNFATISLQYIHVQQKKSELIFGRQVFRSNMVIIMGLQQRRLITLLNVVL